MVSVETGSSTGHVIDGTGGSSVPHAIATMEFRMALICVPRGWAREIHQLLLGPRRTLVPGGSLTEEKKKCSRTTFPKKARGHSMCSTMVCGGWSPLAVGGGWWRLVVGGWWLMGVGGWRLVVPWGGP